MNNNSNVVSISQKDNNGMYKMEELVSKITVTSQANDKIVRALSQANLNCKTIYKGNEVF